MGSSQAPLLPPVLLSTQLAVPRPDAQTVLVTRSASHWAVALWVRMGLYGSSRRAAGLFPGWLSTGTECFPKGQLAAHP
jgi:hypothetical protein